MKRQKILNDVRVAMRQTFGSTERDDAIDAVQDKWRLSSGQLYNVCILTPGRVDYWVR